MPTSLVSHPRAGAMLPTYVGRNVANDATYGGDGVRDELESRGSGFADGELEPRPAAWAPCGETAPAFAGLTHTERYLFDTHGILTLRGALSAEEVAAARAVVERSRGKVSAFEEPALERMHAHPRLLPVLLELMEGEPHLVSTGSATKQPARPEDATTARRPAGAAQLHCQREYNRDAAHFVVRAPGRIYADNLVVFPYFTDCYEGDGGLVVIPGSHKVGLC
jgi:hypothetical protein